MASTFRSSDAACTRCTFFDSQANQAGAGLCRYNPPVSQPSSDVHGLWPVVSGADWCGHFQSGTSA